MVKTKVPAPRSQDHWFAPHHRCNICRREGFFCAHECRRWTAPDPSSEIPLSALDKIRWFLIQHEFTDVHNRALTNRQSLNISQLSGERDVIAAVTIATAHSVVDLSNCSEVHAVNLL